MSFNKGTLGMSSSSRKSGDDSSKSTKLQSKLSEVHHVLNQYVASMAIQRAKSIAAREDRRKKSIQQKLERYQERDHQAVEEHEKESLQGGHTRIPKPLQKKESTQRLCSTTAVSPGSLTQPTTGSSTQVDNNAEDSDTEDTHNKDISWDWVEVEDDGSDWVWV